MAENGYVVTAHDSHDFRDLTNADVGLHSESAKHPSRRTVVKLTAAYFMLVSRSCYPGFKAVFAIVNGISVLQKVWLKIIFSFFF